MFQSLKRIMAALCVLCLLLSGCSGNKKEEQTKENEKIEIDKVSNYIDDLNEFQKMSEVEKAIKKEIKNADIPTHWLISKSDKYAPKAPVQLRISFFILLNSLNGKFSNLL